MKKAEWEVHYARFFNFPSLTSSSSSFSAAAATTSSTRLRPILPNKKRRLKGIWLRCSSSNVSVRIFSPPHQSLLQHFTLVVSLCETVYEEHYVSLLNFTWPKVSGHSNCYIRGIRVIFASYRDSNGQIQKFAMRFSSSAEAQTFIESLKCLKEEMKVNCCNGMSSTVLRHRIFEEPNYANPSVECTMQWQPSIKQEHLTYSFPGQAMLNLDAQVIDYTLPSSFTSLLSDCCSDTEPVLAPAPVEPDLNHFLKSGSMEDYSFIDMLDKVENIIALLGGDLAL